MSSEKETGYEKGEEWRIRARNGEGRRGWSSEDREMRGTEN